MLTSPVARPPSKAVTCLACLLGVLLMGALAWAGVIWLAEPYMTLLQP